LAMSSGSPMRPIIARAPRRSSVPCQSAAPRPPCVMSVRTKPGATAFTVMPCGPSSMAKKAPRQNHHLGLGCRVERIARQCFCRETAFVLPFRPRRRAYLECASVDAALALDKFIKSIRRRFIFRAYRSAARARVAVVSTQRTPCSVVGTALFRPPCYHPNAVPE
jgi:hypothetical protein